MISQTGLTEEQLEWPVYEKWMLATHSLVKPIMKPQAGCFHCHYFDFGLLKLDFRVTEWETKAVPKAWPPLASFFDYEGNFNV